MAADHQRILPVDNDDLEAPAGLDVKDESNKKNIISRTMYGVALLLITVLAILGIMFLVIRPKPLKFSVERVRMTQFEVGDNDTVSATFWAKVKLVNPNERMGVQILRGSSVSAWYMGQKLSEASLPELYQGRRSTRVVRLKMRGRSGNAAALLASLMEAAAGVIPVQLRVDLPVRIKVGALKLPEMMVLARCELEVHDDQMAPIIRIAKTRCKFGLRLL